MDRCAGSVDFSPRELAPIAPICKPNLKSAGCQEIVALTKVHATMNWFKHDSVWRYGRSVFFPNAAISECARRPSRRDLVRRRVVRM